MTGDGLNLLINGFSLCTGPRVLERGFRSIPVRRCIQLTGVRELPPIRSEETPVLHDGKIDGVDWNNIPPLDGALVEAMRDAEAVFMEMMERLEGKGRSMPVTDRKRLYLKTLRYWNHFLEKEEIHLFLCLGFPHRYRTYLIRSLCEKKGIPALHFCHTSPIPSHYYLARHWKTSVIGLAERFAELQKNPLSHNLPLPPVLESYYRSQTGDGDPVPWFARSPAKPEQSRNVRKGFDRIVRGPMSAARQMYSSVAARISFAYWERCIRDIRRRRAAKKLFSFYVARATEPDFSTPFVYLPLQLQPEVTTCPMAGAYNSQILIAEMLHSLLPKNVLLYVKEHPNQQRMFPDGMGRDKNFYDDFLALPRVRLVPRSVSTFALMEHALAVATATGSAGFEGLFRGTPFLMFGYDYYQFAPGVFPVRSREDCERALRLILQGGGKPSVDDMRIFLRALGETTAAGWLTDDMPNAADVTENQCAENLGGMLERRVREVFACDKPSISTS